MVYDTYVYYVLRCAYINTHRQQVIQESYVITITTSRGPIRVHGVYPRGGCTFPLSISTTAITLRVKLTYGCALYIFTLQYVHQHLIITTCISCYITGVTITQLIHLFFWLDGFYITNLKYCIGKVHYTFLQVQF